MAEMPALTPSQAPTAPTIPTQKAKSEYELTRALGVRFIFTERVEGKMTLRRGFEVSKGEREFLSVRISSPLVEVL